MADQLSRLITLRCNSAASMGDDAYIQYYNEVIQVIIKVYRDRYGYESVIKKVNGAIAVPIQSDGHEYYSAMVDYEIFETICLEFMETELVYILNDLVFESENQLKHHIMVSFENILQKQIDKLTPGLATRKKQIYRVLRNYCNSIEIRGVKRYPFWQLEECENTNIIPYEDLMECAGKYQAPPLRYPRPGSNRGPSIRDIDMQEYLLNILRDVGCVVKSEDLLSLIMHKYSINTSKKIDITIGSGDSKDSYTEEERLTVMAGVRDEGDFLSLGHYQIAEMIVDKMNDQQRQVYSSLYFLELNQNETAKRLKYSNATISNVKKGIEKLLTGFLLRAKNKFNMEEMAGILRYISLIINQEKKEY